MNIQMIAIDKIKPDPNQPRKSFDEERIKEMSQSILTEGVINPIEIDDKNIIITGEMRWRSAKKAGLKEVPCKVLDLANDVRFRRQVIENLQHNTMTAWETAESLKKLYDLGQTVAPRRGQPHSIRTLSDEVGKSPEYVSDLISLLKEVAAVKDYLQSKDGKHSLIREVRRQVPDEYKDDVKEKIVKGEINGGRTIRELGMALKRTPEKSEELLSKDYVEEERLNIDKILEISPRKDIIQSSNYASQLKEVMHKTITLLKKYKQEKILSIDRTGIEVLAEELRKELNVVTSDHILEGISVN